MADTHKKRYLPITFPRGVARYPKISKPDTQGQYADGKYKTELVLTEAETKVMKDKLRAFGEQVYPGQEVNLPIKTGKDGVVSFIAKSKKTPMVVDAKRRPLPEGAEIGGGSIIRINVNASHYEKIEKVKVGGKMVNETAYGVNLYLEAVQVIELKTFGDKLAGFQDEDGFDAAEMAADEHGFSDESADDAGETAGSDAYAL